MGNFDLIHFRGVYNFNYNWSQAPNKFYRRSKSWLSHCCKSHWFDEGQLHIFKLAFHSIFIYQRLSFSYPKSIYDTKEQCQALDFWNKLNRLQKLHHKHHDRARLLVLEYSSFPVVILYLNHLTLPWHFSNFPLILSNSVHFNITLCLVLFTPNKKPCSSTLTLTLCAFWKKSNFQRIITTSLLKSSEIPRSIRYIRALWWERVYGCPLLFSFVC